MKTKECKHRWRCLAGFDSVCKKCGLTYTEYIKGKNKMNKNKQPLKNPIPLSLEQYECQICKKKFYINVEDQIDNDLACPLCKDTNVLNVREFDVEILRIGAAN